MLDLMPKWCSRQSEHEQNHAWNFLDDPTRPEPESDRPRSWTGTDFLFQSVSKVGEFLTVPCKTAMYLPNSSFARPETDVTKSAWAAWCRNESKHHHQPLQFPTEKEQDTRAITHTVFTWKRSRKRREKYVSDLWTRGKTRHTFQEIWRIASIDSVLQNRADVSRQYHSMCR